MSSSSEIAGRVVAAGPKLTPSMKTALRLLYQAHEAAEALSIRGKWDFAIEIQGLKEAGLNHNELRCLVCQGLAEHRLEKTLPGAVHRAFGRPRSLRLQARSCFVLSQRGLALAADLPALDANHPAIEVPEGNSTPFWDRQRRELWLGRALVKRFRQPAKNQETILAAFQEDDWPPRIDNPLRGDRDTHPQDRLHDAVKKLNRQANSLLRFLSDGKGQGIVWQFAY